MEGESGKSDTLTEGEILGNSLFYDIMFIILPKFFKLLIFYFCIPHFLVALVPFIINICVPC